MSKAQTLKPKKSNTLYTVLPVVAPNIQLYNMDNLEYMRTCKDNEFDLAIVDPPYGIKRSGQTETFTKNPKHKRKAHKYKGWDDKIPTQEYFDELFRISKNQIIWGANYFVKYLTESKMGWIFWYKGQEGLSMSDGEIAYTSFDKATRIININRTHISTSGGSIHPTQKPKKLYEWILKRYAKQGDKILDTHLGSGSIALACHNYKFDLVGLEIDKEYFDNAVKRFENYKAQLTLF